MDAGDWDRRIQHVDVTYLLLDLFEGSPNGVRDIELGIPKSSEVLDPNLYRDSDELPDLIHEAIWNLDFYRRLQGPDGRVSGGIENSGPNLGEPSFLCRCRAFVFAPDHVSTYRYAAAAAKLAAILETLGKLELAQVYRESAIAAWSSSEVGFIDFGYVLR